MYVVSWSLSVDSPDDCPRHEIHVVFYDGWFVD